MRQIPRNPLMATDFLAVIRFDSYNRAVTTDEFWRAVGEFLMVRRERRELKTSHLKNHGGPHYDTINEIERGRIRNVETLTEYAKALGFEIPDVFRAILQTDSVPLSPELRQVIRKYETTTVRGRRALVALAEALEEEKPGALSGSPDADGGSTKDTPP